MNEFTPEEALRRALRQPALDSMAPDLDDIRRRVARHRSRRRHQIAAGVVAVAVAFGIGLAVMPDPSETTEVSTSAEGPLAEGSWAIASVALPDGTTGEVVATIGQRNELTDAGGYCLELPAGTRACWQRPLEPERLPFPATTSSGPHGITIVVVPDGTSELEVTVGGRTALHEVRSFPPAFSPHSFVAFARTEPGSEPSTALVVARAPDGRSIAKATIPTDQIGVPFPVPDKRSP